MHYLRLLIIFLGIIFLLFFWIYGYLDIRALKIAKKDLGLSLPRPVQDLINSGGWFVFISILVLITIFLLELFNLQM